MAIKWKNSRKAQFKIAGLFLLLIAVVNVLSLPGINQRVGNATSAKAKTAAGDDEEVSDAFEKFFTTLYHGFYLLDLEYQNQKSETQLTPEQLFIVSYHTPADELQEEWEQRINGVLQETLDTWSRAFEKIRSDIDYCVVGEDTDKPMKNTSQMLEYAVSGTDSDIDLLEEEYRELFVVTFDEFGAMEVLPVFSERANGEDMLIKSLGKIAREESLKNKFESYFTDSSVPAVKGPEHISIVVGLTEAQNSLLYQEIVGSYDSYQSELAAYINGGAYLLYRLSCAAVILFVIWFTGEHVCGNLLCDGKRHAYAAELGCVGILCGLALHNAFVEFLWSYSFTSFGAIWNEILEGQTYDVVTSLLRITAILWLIYALWYVSAYLLCPIFSVGIGNYIKNYSFCYQIVPWTKRKFARFWAGVCRFKKKNSEQFWAFVRKLKKKLKQCFDGLWWELTHMNLNGNAEKTIFKVVFVQFLVLFLLSCFGMFGIGALLIYSIVVFLRMKRYYETIKKDYQAMFKAMHTVAAGSFETEIYGDFGIFAPLAEELKQIQSGLKKAVEEEVKSQKMKTELITNVSHDLKTPLTAILTYVELLKKEDITDEERRSYVETLERKSLRLKVLIEDLFEVSKANSNNMVLHKIELDVVNLIRQVRIEYEEKMQEQRLEIRFYAPQEKILVMLDNQKTYRIFENLFVNVVKYAMPGSRVYLEVRKLESAVEVIMKNMSAQELHVSGEEITERFVRGDSARNTEGSGLGLAIAKSFTEAQGGQFFVEVDGDLFKVRLLFKVRMLSG